MNIKIVKTRRGGENGGGSTVLTPEGKKILRECKIVNAMLEFQKGVNEIESVISDIDKDNNVMEIKVDDYKITLPREEGYIVGDKVLALVGYDNIFITLEPHKTSVRNIFKGIITEMKLIDSIFRIKVVIGSLGIYIDITRLASNDLKLDLGKEVYVGFKTMGIVLLKI